MAPRGAISAKWRHVAPFFGANGANWRQMAPMVGANWRKKWRRHFFNSGDCNKSPIGANSANVAPFFNANKMAPPWRHVALVIKNIENRHVAPRGATWRHVAPIFLHFM